MPASLLLGKDAAALRTPLLKEKIAGLVAAGKRAPGLAVILLGDDPASHIYVSRKRAACLETGIRSYAYDLPANTPTQALIKLIQELNVSPHIDGILVQLPLPAHIDSYAVIEQIDPQKDVDGFHPFNLGRLAQKKPALRPCTPLGIMHLLEHYQIPIQGKHAVVIGASNIVGRPMGLELLLAEATVSICNRSTPSLQPFVASADIVVVAAGVIDVIDTAWFRPHQVVVDVGIHRLKNGTVRGDVDFDKAVEKVAWITPVPGGVGPMTIVTLLENTVEAWVSITEY